MKKTLFILMSIMLGALLLYGCQKYFYEDDIKDVEKSLSTPQEVFDFLNEKGVYDISYEEVERLMIFQDFPPITSSPPSNRECYNTGDLINFLPVFNKTVADITPAFYNYHQDIGLGGSYLGQLSLINGEPFFITNVLNVDTLGYQFDWYINGIYQFTGANPRVWNLNDNLICDGVVRLNLKITGPLGDVSEREEWAYFDYLSIKSCVCPDCPLQFEVFYVYYPPVEPYHYQTQNATWDLNGDQIINTADLVLFLDNYCGS